jgi:protein gp37
MSYKRRMGEKTQISWCDHTWNIWWGCDKVSAGCDACYAEAFDHRLGGEHWGPTAPRRFFGDAYWRKPLAWNAAAEKAGVRASVFCSSMADWAEIHQVPEVRERQNEARERLWRLIEETPWIDWLMLSKRPENFAAMLPWTGKTCSWCKPPGSGVDTCEQGGKCVNCGGSGRAEASEPYPNVTLMVTGENTEQLLRRAAILRRTPAIRRGISAEPLLEHIPAEAWAKVLDSRVAEVRHDRLIHWLIVGDESGPNRRPAQLDWVRTAREAALRHGVAFHFKQWNGSGKTVHLPILDGRAHDAR